MLPPVYTKAVLEDYRKKRATGALPFDMKEPSPANLKAACQEVCREKYNRKDEPLLKAFFGEGVDQEACFKAIQACEIDRFRPLVNFLKERTANPDDKVVELIAWLIDFKDRPYDYKKDYSTPDITVEVEPVPSGRSYEGPKTMAVATPQKKREGKKLILTIAVLVTLGIVIYWVLPGKPTVPTGPQACMYWADDHYQPVDCNTKMENVQVIALDSEKVLHLKKITRPDTITANAKGSVWYVRYRGNYEFYTDSGFHPIDPQLRLRPVTDYIISRHVPANP